MLFRSSNFKGWSTEAQRGKTTTCLGTAEAGPKCACSFIPSRCSAEKEKPALSCLRAPEQALGRRRAEAGDPVTRCVRPTLLSLYQKYSREKTVLPWLLVTCASQGSLTPGQNVTSVPLVHLKMYRSPALWEMPSCGQLVALLHTAHPTLPRKCL